MSTSRRPVRRMLVPMAIALLAGSGLAVAKPDDGHPGKGQGRPPGHASPATGNPGKAPETPGTAVQLPGTGRAADHDAVRTELHRAGVDRNHIRELIRLYDIQLSAPSALPPGIAKNLARGKPLPPGIAKRYPPDALLRRLPQFDGYEWLEVGRDLVLVAVGTATVVDILLDVLTG